MREWGAREEGEGMETLVGGKTALSKIKEVGMSASIFFPLSARPELRGCLL